MRSLIRFHITQHDGLVAESGSPLQQRSPPTGWVPAHSGMSRPLPRTLREALLVHTVNCIRFWPKTSPASRLLSLVFFCSRALIMPMAATCSAGFFLGHFCTFFSLTRRRRKLLEFKLYLVQLSCLPRELGGHPHEILFHAVPLERGMNSQLRYHEKMVD